ncbi:MAG: hypothetical protein LH470_01805 [Lysobacter sp.]|nr:hypothetical protein [Lysobacter sp.]
MLAALGMAACTLLCMSCSDDPRVAVESRPASAASSPPQAQPGEAQSMPPAEQRPVDAPAIMVAQIGRKLGTNGLLQEPDTNLLASAPIYGLAIFKGRQDQQGEVVLQIFDAANRQVFNQQARYVVQGETSVGFKAKAAGEPWSTGSYRVLYTCNGKPCWEIKFTLK